MSKPDDIPQDIWTKAVNIWSVIPTVHHTAQEGMWAAVNIARAMMEAKAEAYQEALAVVSEFIWDDHALEQATDIGRACHHQSVEIAAAIRQRGEGK